MKMWEIVALPQGDEILKNGRVADTEEVEHILNSHERLVEALRQLLKTPRGCSGRIILEADEEVYFSDLLSELESKT